MTSAHRDSTRPTARRTASIALSGLLVVGAVGTLAACQKMSPVATSTDYAPADGVSADLGPIQARDLYVVSASAGGPAAVGGLLINNGTSAVSVSVVSQAQNDSTSGVISPNPSNTVSIPAGKSAQLGGRIGIPTVAAAPGAMTAIVLHTPDGQTLVNVPVLAKTGDYATMTPPAAPTSPTTRPTTAPTGTATGTATAPTGTAPATTGSGTPAAPTAPATTAG